MNLFKKDNVNNIVNIPIQLIYSNINKAYKEKDIQNICDSIRQYGLLQPILVRSMPNNTYELISGNKRLKAVKKVGYKKIPAIIIHANDNEIAEIKKLEIKDSKYKIKKKDNKPKNNKIMNKIAEQGKKKREIGDTRILINTFKQAIEVMKKAGAKIYMIQKENEKKLEIRVKLEKKQD